MRSLWKCIAAFSTPVEKSPGWLATLTPVLGLCGKIFVPGGLQGQPLGEGTRSCLHVEQSHFQTAPKGTQYCPKLSQSVSNTGGISVIFKKG